MTSVFRRRGRVALSVALIGLVFSAFVMTAVLARPRAAPTGLLGAEWSCGQLFWVTSCTRIEPTTRGARHQYEPYGEAAGLRPV